MEHAIQIKEDTTLRDYYLLDKIDNLLRSISNTNELTAVLTTIHIIAEHLHNKHFDEKIQINIKALVKTFGELDEIGAEILHHNLTQNT